MRNVILNKVKYLFLIPKGILRLCLRMTFLLFIIVVFVLLVLFPKKVFAEKLSLGVYPPLIRIISNDANNIKTPLTIQNPGNTPLKLGILFKPFEVENGEVSFLPSGDKLPLDISLLNNNSPVSEIEIGEKQTKDFILNIDISKNQASADYYFSIVFVTVPQALASPSLTWQSWKGVEAQADVSLGVGTNVLLTVGQEEKANGVIEEFKAPFFKESGPLPFTLRIKNTGKTLFQPYGNILVKNIFNQTVGKIDLDSNYILKDSVRTFNPIWKENFLLGVYTATVQIGLSKDGPILAKTAYFISFPFIPALTIMFIVVLISLIKLKMKNYKLK